MSAWTKQLAAQVKKHGKAKASWYCEWDEPDGTRRMKSCGPGKSDKKAAERMQERIKAELLTGTYDRQAVKTWAEFRKEYRQRVLSGRAAKTMYEAGVSLDHFERILKLADKKMTAITASRIAEFVAKRRTERGKKAGSTVSPATINKDLRMIKAALNVAREWGCIKSVPKIKFEKEPKKLPRYVESEHFASMYAACDVATKPGDEYYEPAVWWRALLVMAYMTGWRIGELLALKWDDVDLDAGTAITRWGDNKGSRDEIVSLHPVVIEHIRPLMTFSPHVFPWSHHRRTLDTEFARIQDEAGIYLPCDNPRPHECTPACHRYGFHDERRAFATLNAENMTREALQALMRHQSPLTTARYINMARQLNPAVANLHVPAVLQADAG